MRPQRQHRLAVVADRMLSDDAQHVRLAGAVNVGVQYADRRALPGQGERQVRGDGRLADAALAGGDGDDVADAIDPLDIALHGVASNTGNELDVRVRFARLLAQRVGQLLANRRVSAGTGEAQLDARRDAVGLDRYVRHPADLAQRALNH